MDIKKLLAGFKEIHNFTEKEVGSASPRREVIFEQQTLPQQTIYCWKEYLKESRIPFKYWKNI